MYIYICIYIATYICIYIYIQIRCGNEARIVFIFIFILVSVYTNPITYIRIHMCIYTHKYSYTHKHAEETQCLNEAGIVFFIYIFIFTRMYTVI